MNEEGQIGEGERNSEPSDQPWSQQQPEQQQQGQQQSQRTQQPPQSSPRRQPPRRQMFSSERLNKTLGMALVIGVVLLFIGGMLVSSAGFIEVQEQGDWNLKRNLNAVATLLGSLGLLAIGGAASWAFYQADQLTEKQRTFLILLIIGAMIGFALLLSSGPIGASFF